jgi:hypothetical protein
VDADLDKLKCWNGGDVNAARAVGMKRMRCLSAVFVVSALLVWVESAQANQPPRNPILNDLKYLSLGVHYYESKHGSLPLAASDAHPPSSWRVAILPLLEFVDVPAGYDFNIPWNAPGNQSVLEKIPECYTYYEGFDFTPYFPNAPRPTDTCYLAVVDDRTMWLPGRPSRFVTRDGASSTVLLLEAPEMRVPWTEPRDLTFDEAVDFLGKPVRRYADHWFWVVEYYGYTRAVNYVDLHSQQITPISKEFASALLTRSGGENIPENPSKEHYVKLEWPKPIYVYKWPRIIGCSVAAAAVGFLLGGIIYVRGRRRAANALVVPLTPPGVAQ